MSLRNFHGTFRIRHLHSRVPDIPHFDVFDVSIFQGSCIQVEDSKYEDEKFLEPAADDDNYIPDEISLDNLPSFYIIPANDIREGNSTGSAPEADAIDLKATEILLNETLSLIF